MNFSVRLDAEQVGVDPGDKALLAIEVTNSGPETDQYEIIVEGLDPEWTAVLVPSFSVPAGSKAVESIIFQPPRANESMAAAYPFTVKVRSLESGEQRVLAGVLNVRSFTHLSMEILPKKGVYSPMVRDNTFQVTVMNLGNAEQTLQLFGSDPDEELAYSFEPEHVTVGPGHQKEIEVAATPIHSRPLAGARLHGFTISARNPDTPNSSCAAQAQLEQRPLLTAGSLAIFIAFLVLVVGWLQFAPKPPVVDTFSSDKRELLEGEKYTVTWQSSNAKSVKIFFNSREVVSAGQPDGSQQFTASESGTYRIVAIRESKESGPKEFSINVTEVITPGPAVIGEFTLTPTTVAPGEDVMFTYKTTGATKLTLRPDGILLDPTESSRRIAAPAKEGSYSYQLVASNEAGDKTESRTIKLTVRREPKAAIVSFVADPTEIESVLARTTISWEVKRATRIEIRCDGKTYTSTDQIGTMEIDVFKSGDCELVAFDEDDVPIKKSIRLTVKAAEPPADDAKTSDTGNTGAAGATGSTGTPPSGGGTASNPPPLTNTGGGRR